MFRLFIGILTDKITYLYIWSYYITAIIEANIKILVFNLFNEDRIFSILSHTFSTYTATFPYLTAASLDSVMLYKVKLNLTLNYLAVFKQ